MRIWTKATGIITIDGTTPADPTTAYDADGNGLSWSTANGRTVLVGGPHEPPLFADVKLDPADCLILAPEGEVFVAPIATVTGLACIDCGTGVFDTAADGRIGDTSGKLCRDCAYWSDGNFERHAEATR